MPPLPVRAREIPTESFTTRCSQTAKKKKKKKKKKTQRKKKNKKNNKKNKKKKERTIKQTHIYLQHN
eukprot:NODE_23062_length_682_cov_1.733333.p4 GENE.NODE_23062_length_682_cov_1.733333~~NODE_23062_length_682_cov_1.733333.p4  ORF type:complete len:67 (-),score=34.69 NODE_23062_length_682_cov_1.733333:10-210(-)